LENGDGEEDGSQWHGNTDQVLFQIKSQLNTEKGKVVSFSKKKWLRLAVAAVLVAGIFAVYKYMHASAVPEQTIVKAATTNNPISAGGNKATLILENGSAINLETASNDTVVEQKGSRILKQADGQLLYTSLKEKPASVSYNRIVTPRGGQYQVILSDGTKIWLNDSSSVHYPVVFTGSERKVEVTGEAYFEVAKDASKPFKVKIGEKAEVEVLGTHFDVNAYTDELVIRATLLEGSIKISELQGKESRMIIPGEQAALNASNRITVNKIPDTEQVIAWKNGVFNFYNTSLGMALRQLARWYDVDIVFEGSIPQKQFSGEIQRSLSLSQVVKLLEKNGVNCRIEGKKLIVTK
jgi:ferric-dicitrate binding protein FerR (iron transport regulator)